MRVYWFVDGIIRMLFRGKKMVDITYKGAIIGCEDGAYATNRVIEMDRILGSTQGYDLIFVAGGVKEFMDSDQEEIKVFCTSIDVTVQLHKAHEFHIVAHNNCGAYGGTDHFNHDLLREKRHHHKVLHDAAQKLIRRYGPETCVHMYYEQLSEAGEYSIMTMGHWVDLRKESKAEPHLLLIGNGVWDLEVQY